MNKLQTELLDVLKEFTSFCKKNKLTYFADGGTLLGAIRHKGFIPWDDDVDICMPRNDYNKFIELYKSDDYFLQTPETDSTYTIPFCKLRKNNSNLILEDVNNTNSHSGPFIDIYALDSIPIDEDVYDSLKGFIRTIRKYNCGTSKDGFRYLNELLTASTNQYKDSMYVLPIVFSSYKKFENIKIPRVCYKIAIYKQFEDIKIAVPFWYEKVLECWYDDWKIEKRTNEVHAKVKEKENEKNLCRHFVQ